MSKLGINEAQAAPQFNGPVSPDQVRALTQPTSQFLCQLSDNWPKMRFGGFKIRDMISGITLVEVKDEEVDNDNVSDSDDP